MGLCEAFPGRGSEGLLTAAAQKATQCQGAKSNPLRHFTITEVLQKTTGEVQMISKTTSFHPRK